MHGRYDDTTSFDFMSRGGIWVENFALPAVINECLLQSYDGVLRLFPNWPRGVDASYRTLRAAGAFLVSARLYDGVVTEVDLISEVGGELRIELPWSAGCHLVSDGTIQRLEPGIARLTTTPGQVLRLRPPAA